MFSTPAPIWNEIAETQRIKSPLWKRLMQMDGIAMAAELDRVTDKLPEKDSTVLLAYQATACLLAENEAISRYLESTDQLGLRSSLPELTSIPEAVDLATMEYRLEPSQQNRLAELLERQYPLGNDSNNKN